MKKYKKRYYKNKIKNNSIIIMAYIHRYGFLILILGLLAKVTNNSNGRFLGAGIISILYALYDLIGYKLKWKHIYCSFQSLQKQRMTPDRIIWRSVDKKDVYTIVILCGATGIMLIIAEIVFYFL